MISKVFEKVVLDQTKEFLSLNKILHDYHSGFRKNRSILQTYAIGFLTISIHFGEDKTKSILFASKPKIKKFQKIEIIYNNIRIKQHSRLTYLGCILEEIMSGESMAHKVIRKADTGLKFLHSKNKCLTSNLRRLLCKALIQPHFDYSY